MLFRSQLKPESLGISRFYLSLDPPKSPESKGDFDRNLVPPLRSYRVHTSQNKPVKRRTVGDRQRYNKGFRAIGTLARLSEKSRVSAYDLTTVIRLATEKINRRNYRE